MNLTPRLILGDVELTDYPFAVEFGSDLGVAANVVKVIESGLLDGEIQRVSGSSNRTISVPVLLESSDLAGLAEAEALLANECAKDVNEFRIDPGDGYGATTVFTVFRAQFSFQRDDELEQHGFRRYVIEMAALPFGQSEEEVVDVANEVPPAVPSVVTVSDGSSSTGWTSPGGAVTSSSGAVVVPSAGPVSSFDNYGTTVYAYSDSATLALTTVDFTATPYITAALKWRSSEQFTFTSAFYYYRAFVDGDQLDVASVEYDSATQNMLMTWRCSDASATSLRIETDYFTTNSGATTGLLIDSVVRRNYIPNAPASSGRQSTRSVTVSGSARTAAAVAIEHETAGLGDVLFYTSPYLGDAYSPAMRRWLNPAGPIVEVDSSTLSGVYSQSNGGHFFDVDADALPAGPHLVAFQARGIDGLAMPDVVVTVRTLVNGVTFDEQVMPTVEGGALNFAIYVAGVVTLPGVKLPMNSNAIVQFEVSGGTVELAELLSYHVGGDSDLTYVKAGAGTPARGTVHNRLFLDAPSIENDGQPALYVGTQPDRSDAFHPGYPGVRAWGQHPMSPPVTLMHVVTTGAANPSVTLRHRPSWHTHAAK